jgi:cytochrome b6-f complex iron-sulfur subunit
MADEKKKLSIAEILAAARKADGQGQAGDPPPAPAAQPQESAPAADSTEKPAAKPKPAAGGSRPSVAEMMAAARAEKSGTAKTSDQPAPEKPATKPAAKEAAQPAAKSASAKSAPPAQATPSGPKDTASILAAARGAKPGPMTKAEAAAAPVARKSPPPKPAAAPPMPQRPQFSPPKPAAAVAAPGRRELLFNALFGSFLGVGFTSMAATFGLWTLGSARFMFPNILTEPPSRFKVGFKSNFAPGQVETKFVAQYGVWVVNAEYKGEPQIFALRTVCTHLGCTPNWLEGEQKFKCPCHGSGFYKDGINFEGPAPRPLERYAIYEADDGQLEIDKSKLFQEELGQWMDSASFVRA